MSIMSSTLVLISSSKFKTVQGARLCWEIGKKWRRYYLVKFVAVEQGNLELRDYGKFDAVLECKWLWSFYWK